MMNPAQPRHRAGVAVAVAIAIAAIFGGVRPEIAQATPNGPQAAVGLYWFYTGDPTVAPGIQAPLYQLLVRLDTPGVYWKSGSATTAWTKIGTGAGGGAGTVTSVGCGSGLTCSPSPIIGAGTVTLGLPPTTCAAGSAMTGVTAFGVGACAAFGSGTITGSGTTGDIAVFAAGSAIGNYTGATCSGSAVTAIAANGTLTCASFGTGTVTSSTLTANTIPKATSASAIGDSLLTDNATQLSYNNGVFTVAALSGNAVTTGTLTSTLAFTALTTSLFTQLATAMIGIAYGDTTLPSSPSSGLIAVSVSTASRSMLTLEGAKGAPQIMQAHQGFKNWGQWVPVAGSATASVVGFPAVAATGTATARTPGSTSLFTSLKRTGYVSSAGTASVAGARDTVADLWRGNGANEGGFYIVIKFGISDSSLVTDGRTFVGLWSTTTAPTDVEPSTLTNCFGIGNGSADTVMHLYMSGSVAQAPVSLGASFPSNTTNTDIYQLVLYAAPNDSQISWAVTDLTSGAGSNGVQSTAANLFSNTTFVTVQAWRSNGAIASAVGIDVFGLYKETDY